MKRMLSLVSITVLLVLIFALHANANDQKTIDVTVFAAEEANVKPTLPDEITTGCAQLQNVDRTPPLTLMQVAFSMTTRCPSGKSCTSAFEATSAL